MGRTGALASVLVLALSCVAMTGCGPLKYTVPSSRVAPGADAKIVAKVLKKQGQTLLEIEATNLVPPERILDEGTQFVVWYRRDSSTGWNRIGSLVYDASSREGNLNGSAPETSFDLQVSAETNTPPASPSSTIVFAQRIGKD